MLWFLVVDGVISNQYYVIGHRLHVYSNKDKRKIPSLTNLLIIFSYLAKETYKIKNYIHSRVVYN